MGELIQGPWDPNLVIRQGEPVRPLTVGEAEALEVATAAFSEAIEGAEAESEPGRFKITPLNEGDWRIQQVDESDGPPERAS